MENVVLPSLFNVICRTEINCYFNSTSLLFSPWFLITDSSVHRASCIKGDFGFSQYFHCKNLSQKTPVCTKLQWQGPQLQCAQNSDDKVLCFHRLFMNDSSVHKIQTARTFTFIFISLTNDSNVHQILMAKAKVFTRMFNISTLLKQWL